MKDKLKHNLQLIALKLMLLVYVFGIVKPITPILKDTLAHAFFNSEHNATMHYENGKYHLHLELVKENKKTDASQIPNTEKYETVSLHLKTTVVEFSTHSCIIQSKNETPYFGELVDKTIVPVLLPPRC